MSIVGSDYGMPYYWNNMDMPFGGGYYGGYDYHGMYPYRNMGYDMGMPYGMGWGMGMHPYRSPYLGGMGIGMYSYPHGGMLRRSRSFAGFPSRCY